MKRLPLNERHEALGARMGEFAGYSMPLYYAKPVEEHHAVRNEVGVFDISHMGQLRAEGKEAEAFFQYALANDVLTMEDGQARYSPLCREDGGVLDDLILYRYDRERYRVIVNAATREKDVRRLQAIASKFEVALEDISAGWCLFAVAGPRAFSLLAPRMGASLSDLAYYRFVETEAFGVAAFVARTGYTGEPGCEIAVPVQDAETVWRGIVEGLGIRPIGLAARDTLRLEACMALYGHELREEWNALESGLGWAVKLDVAEDFVGKAALQAVQAKGPSHALVALELTGRGIPRADYPVLVDGEPVGSVTSGVLSPTTGKPIALARVAKAAGKAGTALQVEIRGKAVEGVVVRKPFYKNPELTA